MIKILFICHGNICRSPMAEFVMKDLIKSQNCSHDFFIASAATSTEEIGNPVHRGTREKLRQYGICTAGKYAVQLCQADPEKTLLTHGTQETLMPLTRMSWMGAKGS